MVYYSTTNYHEAWCFVKFWLSFAHLFALSFLNTQRYIYFSFLLDKPYFPLHVFTFFTCAVSFTDLQIESQQHVPHNFSTERQEGIIGCIVFHNFKVVTSLAQLFFLLMTSTLRNTNFSLNFKKVRNIVLLLENFTKYVWNMYLNRGEYEFYNTPRSILIDFPGKVLSNYCILTNICENKFLHFAQVRHFNEYLFSRIFDF